MAIIYLFLYMREMPAPENSDTGWVMRVEISFFPFIFKMATINSNQNSIHLFLS